MQITLMLADDHTIVRDGLRSLLEKVNGFQVIGVASNGREAVEEALRLRPAVVVMDIAMPDMNGVEATRQIMEKLPGTRVLILSMYLSAEHIHRSLKAGAKGYVLKESAGDEVVEAIRALHAGKRYLSHRITDTVLDDYLSVESRLSPIDSLSLRERDVLQLVVEGRTNAAIAVHLSLSIKTVETYRARIMKKLKVKDTVELVKFAMRHGLVA